jgi:ubiquinone/menaquinone biosynthesis C-methylase UbiE
MKPSRQQDEVERRFGAHAEAYVTSVTHAHGSELDTLVEMAQPQPGWQVLDIATGGGHAALKFAPYVARVVATDLTLPMLMAARRHHDALGQTNVAYITSDAGWVAARPGAFDLVICRIAAHHFPDPFRFVQEAARVLRPGGVFLLQDQMTPDDPLVARYVNAFERLRDPSHRWAYSEIEWRGMALDAGLQIGYVTSVRKTHSLEDWAQRMGADGFVDRLQILLKQAPDGARAWLNPVHAGQSGATFDNIHLLMLARKSNH